jgi:hypothetical protein
MPNMKASRTVTNHAMQHSLDQQGMDTAEQPIHLSTTSPNQQQLLRPIEELIPHIVHITF